MDLDLIGVTVSSIMAGHRAPPKVTSPLPAAEK
jgi:hypothetical protein